MADIVAELTWARGAVGVTVHAVQVASSLSTPYAEVGFVTMPLPNLSLAPKSYITIQRINQGDQDQHTLTPITVTYTPTEAPSDVEQVAVGPYMLVPGPGA